MPVYEFLCQNCNTKSSILLRSVTEPSSVTCPACGSNKLERTVTTFAYHKSLKTIHEESGEPKMLPSPDYYKDPRNIGRWAEKKVKELGLEMPPQVEEMIQAAREGEMPPPVKDLQS